jgi:hypothetical protein
MRLIRFWSAWWMVAFCLSGALWPPAPLAAQAAANEAVRWLDPDGKPLQFVNHEQVCDFLRTASVVTSTEISASISKPRKLLLEKDGVRLHAIFRTVNVKAFNSRIRPDHQLLLRDSYAYEVAAYRLSLLLGLDNVPPVVLRELDGRKGSVQLWIEKARSDSSLATLGTVSAHSRYVDLQKRLLTNVFDNLIFNFDRNTSNLLIGDNDGKLWFIDHTRTFTRMGSLPHPEILTACDRNLWERLNQLDRLQLQRELGSYLDAGQISALIRRQKLLLRHYQKLIKERGESRVLFDLQQLRGSDRATG